MLPPNVLFAHYESCLFSAMFSFAFFFGLRVSEITKSLHNIKLSQIKIDNNSLLLNFLSYKHSTSHDPPHVFKSLNTSFCPVFLLNAYLLHRPNIGLETPLFVLNDKAVSSTNFNKHLKKVIKHLGLNEKSFSSHSFRIGAINHWNSKSLSELQVKQLGRYRSNALYCYMRNAISHSI